MVGKSYEIHAVVVVFNPERAVLAETLSAVSPQVDRVWVINNSPRVSLGDGSGDFSCLGNVVFLNMAQNLGLGAAQNEGIKYAKRCGASHVLILDQDSRPMGNMVEYLCYAIDRCRGGGIRVATAAPVNIDRLTGGVSGFVRLGWFDYTKVFPACGHDFLEIDFAISSGSLIPIEVLDDVGLIDEDLFIDHVDTEWCLRVRSKGYKVIGVPSARMLHSLGERRKKIWFLRWRNVPFHAPFRYYYMVRNSLLLQRRGYVPWRWRIGEFIRLCQLVIFFGFVGRNSFMRMLMMLRGFRDGFLGVYGRMPSR